MSCKDKISIFVITGSANDPCSIIRLLSPLKYLVREDLVKPTYFYWDAEYTDADFNHLEDRWRLADIVIFQRGVSLEGMFLVHEIADKCGRIFVYEIDDNLLEVPKAHPQFFWYLAHKETIQAIISKSDAITTTTPILAEHLKQLNPAVYVLPNLIDPELFSQGEESEKNKCGKTILGYTGTTTHLSDFYIIVSAIKRILEEFDGRVLFRSIGFLPDELLDFPNVEYLGTADYTGFPKKLQNACFDIGLGPLEDNLFNRCKSNIKFLEYGICGIPGIWSDVFPYTESVVNGENGILVKEHSSEVWYKAIKLLMENEELRKRLSLNVKKTILDKFLLPNHVYKWYELYKSLIENNKKLQANKGNDQGLFRKLFMMSKDYEVSIHKYVDKAIKKYEDVLSKSEMFLSTERVPWEGRHGNLKRENLKGIVLIHHTLGSLYKKQRLFEKAKEHFKRVIDLSYEMLPIESSKYKGGAHFHLGCIYQALNRRDEAKREFKNCLRLIPDHKKAKENLK